MATEKKAKSTNKADTVSKETTDAVKSAAPTKPANDVKKTASAVFTSRRVWPD